METQWATHSDVPLPAFIDLDSCAMTGGPRLAVHLTSLTGANSVQRKAFYQWSDEDDSRRAKLHTGCLKELSDINRNALLARLVLAHKEVWSTFFLLEKKKFKLSIGFLFHSQLTFILFQCFNAVGSDTQTAETFFQVPCIFFFFLSRSPTRMSVGVKTSVSRLCSSSTRRGDVTKRRASGA